MDEKACIFIGGCPRSGTTMLGSMLGGGEDCVVTPESHFKQTVLLAYGASWQVAVSSDWLYCNLKNNFRFKIWHTALPNRDKLPDLLRPLEYGWFVNLLVDEYAKKHGVTSWKTWVDHTPQNIQNPLMIMRIFPDARFIHLVRDPRAVAASVLPLDWGPDSAEEAATFWAQKLAYGLALEQSYPDRCLRVYYEDIVRSPRETMIKISDFCGVGFNDLMLEGRAFQVPTYTKQQHQLVGSRPDPKRLESWRDKLDAWQIATIENALGDLMVQMGYELLNVDLPSRRTFQQKITLKMTPFFSFLKKKRFQIKKWLYD